MNQAKANRAISFYQEEALVIANILFQQHMKDHPTHGHHKMIIAKTRLIILFAAKEVGALYSQKKQDQVLTVTQLLNPYCKIQAQN